MLRKALDDAAQQQQNLDRQRQQHQQQYDQECNGDDDSYDVAISVASLATNKEMLTSSSLAVSNSSLGTDEELIEDDSVGAIVIEDEVNDVENDSIRVPQTESVAIAESSANLSRQLQLRQQQIQDYEHEQQQQQQQRQQINPGGYGSIMNSLKSRQIPMPTSSSVSVPSSSSHNQYTINNNRFTNSTSTTTGTITPKKSILKTPKQDQSPESTIGTTTQRAVTTHANESTALNQSNVLSHRRSMTANDATTTTVLHQEPSSSFSLERRELLDTKEQQQQQPDDNDEDEYSMEVDDDDDDDEEDGVSSHRRLRWWEKVRDSAVTLFFVVADVENLWDSPDSNELPPSVIARRNRQQQQQALLLSKTSSAEVDANNTNYHRKRLDTTVGGVDVTIRGQYNTSFNGIEDSVHYDPVATAVDDYDDVTDDEWLRWYNTNRRRNNTVVLFWFVVLAASYAAERSTFKLLVDQVEPFRLVSAQYVTAIHAILVCTGIALERFYCSTSSTSTSTNTSPTFSSTASATTSASSTQGFNISRRQHEHHLQDQQFAMWKLPLGIPYVDVGFMAILDSITLLLLFLSGSHVPPLCTVILIQFTIPLTAFLTQFIHPDGRFHCLVKWLSKQCASDDDDDDDNNSLDAGIDSTNKSNAPTNDQHQHHQPPPPPPSHLSNEATSSFQQLTQKDGKGAAVDAPALAGYGGLAAEHVWGSVVLSLAVLFALLPALYSLVNPKYFTYADTIPIRTAVNTLVYVASCIPAAASQLYKEHVFLQHRQPVNMNYLNLLLSILQFLIAIVVSPLLFTLQGLSSTVVDDWTTLYPSTKYRENYIDSLKCLFNILSDDDQLNKYPEDAQCKYAFVLVLLQAFSIIVVGVAVDKIVNAGATKVMYRGISAGIIGAVLCMKLYDAHLPEYNYGPIITTLNFICLILLVLGSELYHRLSLQESTFETIYPEIHIQSYEGI
jgi:CRT-like, chloroquine-resistance transporter-like